MRGLSTFVTRWIPPLVLFAGMVSMASGDWPANPDPTASIEDTACRVITNFVCTPTGCTVNDVACDSAVWPYREKVGAERPLGACDPQGKNKGSTCRTRAYILCAQCQTYQKMDGNGCNTPKCVAYIAYIYSLTIDGKKYSFTCDPNDP